MAAFRTKPCHYCVCGVSGWFERHFRSRWSVSGAWRRSPAVKIGSFRRQKDARTEKTMKATSKGAGRAVAERFANIAPDMADFIIDFSYGDIFSGGVLCQKYKEIAGVAAMARQNERRSARGGRSWKLSCRWLRMMAFRRRSTVCLLPRRCSARTSSRRHKMLPRLKWGARQGDERKLLNRKLKTGKFLRKIEKSKLFISIPEPG